MVAASGGGRDARRGTARFGFILGSGSEVPLNAKVENVEAIDRVARGLASNAIARA
jgi:hypothetical protein